MKREKEETEIEENMQEEYDKAEERRGGEGFGRGEKGI